MTWLSWLAIPALIIGVMTGIFLLATRWERLQADKQLVGQLAGPTIAALVALFAAYLALQGIQSQIDAQGHILTIQQKSLSIQQKSLNVTQSEILEARVARVLELAAQSEKLILMIKEGRAQFFAPIISKIENGSIAEVRDQPADKIAEFRVSFAGLVEQRRTVEAHFRQLRMTERSSTDFWAFIGGVAHFESSVELGLREMEIPGLHNQAPGWKLEWKKDRRRVVQESESKCISLHHTLVQSLIAETRSLADRANQLQ